MKRIGVSFLQISAYNGHVYYLLAEDTWYNSEAEAVSLGGHLVTVNDAAENAWVYDTFKGKVEEILGVGFFGGSLWLGWEDLNNDDVWEWISGEPVTYVNGAPGQPSNGLTEILGGMSVGDWWAPGFSGRWHDITDPQMSWDHAFGVVEVPGRSVDMDIKPGSCPNPLNVASKGVLPVAVLGTQDFDVLTLDPASIRLAGIAPIRSSYADVSSPVSHADGQCACTIGWPDGYLDLTLKFDIQDIVRVLGPVSDGDLVLLALLGKNRSGARVAGMDCVTIIRRETTDPKKALVGHWKLDEKEGSVAHDSSGNGYDGLLQGNPAWHPKGGAIQGALLLDGVDDFVSLPIGSLISRLTNCTITSWAEWSGEGAEWQRVFDFGGGPRVNMLLTADSSDNRHMRFVITVGGSSAEQQVTAPVTLPRGWHHVSVAIDADDATITLYLDGVAVAENTEATLNPSDLGATGQNWLGRSQYSADPYYKGSLDDFRIYDQTLSVDQIQAIMKGD